MNDVNALLYVRPSIGEARAPALLRRRFHGDDQLELTVLITSAAASISHQHAQSAGALVHRWCILLCDCELDQGCGWTRPRSLISAECVATGAYVIRSWRYCFAAYRGGSSTAT